jgi:hypothetical protein
MDRQSVFVLLWKWYIVVGLVGVPSLLRVMTLADDDDDDDG